MNTHSWPRAVFERLHIRHANPWGVGTSAYERRKYRQTLALLAGRHFMNALELGCSIGVMTARLARQCDRLLAVDVSRIALRRARLRCTGREGVSFYRGHLPGGFPALPARGCDLIVISELLYFLSPADITRLAGQCLRVRRSGAPIMLVNWTGPTDTPCTGDEAARHFVACCLRAGLRVVHARRHVGYRLDMLADGGDGADTAMTD
ncbi:class I SAM-dependent methyltransferase [Komagataeibacter rhaeticus]|uniref:SAM-dependent methyltransferase n=1 Tax=Komagataeibacter rhaeticus TaxID=215221 RepID=UPI0004D4DCAF|nr:SAM-dependent methyltransferase [Komagataeibacter rhaeticus]KDU97425.1 methyltransferase [Komagataeibacter rhaeticus AF1]MBL7238971.1 class I SAM-dependent methyltransferase [Komagataeibacter rhaeticus]PYD54244.1 class I SAM-dependent methyltransferase [Komagataeibacter rhaeticus]GBQ15028.1 SAM-dependent methyltransferase [Komagataeibacter rhaeticus DSM 16663]